MNRTPLIIRSVVALSIALLSPASTRAQAPKEYIAAEAGDPGRAKPNYPVPYGPTTVAAITEVLNRIHAYLDANTPARVINKQTGAEITDFSKPDTNAIVERGHFSITAYEWGVTYSGMLLAAENTGDARFKDYVAMRMKFIVDKAPYFRALGDSGVKLENNQLRQVLRPGALDDSGSMCAAMIKAQRAGLVDARPIIGNWMNYISTKQFRLADGTLARKRPMQDSLWLDDLYMSVPALAQMGKLIGDRKYYDDAVKQITQFSSRMFNNDLGIYLHGWIAGMEVHPEFHWARANGWALMAMTELLEVLPEDHPGRAGVLAQFRLHARGLQALQAHNGLWHQLLDRNDSYLETSASAIYAFCLARGINRGWIDALAYGPTVQLAWNGVATKVNAQGEVEGTCVGTGMGFDPAFYYYRPQSARAAHGYGPVLLAGAEMIALTKSGRAVINDGAVQFGHQPTNTESAK
ncbi:MAG: glycoside hydrolase family 88 protein [Verrucomicrobia bacterium]|nr:MAG: glycoside hydrolase family 88 protein [Verrucomicrobiota bacterium]